MPTMVTTAKQRFTKLRLAPVFILFSSRTLLAPPVICRRGVLPRKPLSTQFCRGDSIPAGRMDQPTGPVNGQMGRGPYLLSSIFS